VNVIDTAERCGDHLAESLVGGAIASDRERWVVATKFGHRLHTESVQPSGWDAGALRSDHCSPGEVVGQLEDSLRALGTDDADLCQSHGGSEADFETSGLWEALEAQVRAGKIRHLGISLDPDDGARAARACAVGACVIQVTYNRLNRAAEERVLPAGAAQGLGVLAREPVDNGYLSGKYSPGSRINSSGDCRFSHDLQEVDARLDAVARIEATELPSGVPLARCALAWCLAAPRLQRGDPGQRDDRAAGSQRGRCRARSRFGRPPPGGGAVRGTLRIEEAR
jgi:aryl-alcohol dehydrogenase-like predicted oxidoreductase